MFIIFACQGAIYVHYACRARSLVVVVGRREGLGRCDAVQD